MIEDKLTRRVLEIETYLSDREKKKQKVHAKKMKQLSSRIKNKILSWVSIHSHRRVTKVN